MEIKLNNLNYDFDSDGNTSGVTTGFTGIAERCTISSTIYIEQADLPDGKTFDDVSKNDLTTIGRTKLADLTDDAANEEDEVTEPVVSNTPTDDTKAKG